MAVKFFGQYLLEKNIITREQLVEAVEYQEAKNLKFGEYALTKGYITEKDIERIRTEQKRVDMRFGEIAVKLNILTAQKVQEILTMQKNDNLFIGDILTLKGFVTREALEKELSLFNEEQKEFKPGLVQVPEGVKNPDIIKHMVDLTLKMLERVAYLKVKAGPGIVSTKEPEKNYVLVSVSMSGNLQFIYALLGSQEVSEQIANAIMGEGFREMTREIIVDCVKEFANIACGNIISLVAQEGRSININPPEEIVYSPYGYNLLKGRKAIYYPLVTLKGDCQLVLIEE